METPQSFICPRRIGLPQVLGPRTPAPPSTTSRKYGLLLDFARWNSWNSLSIVYVWCDFDFVCRTVLISREITSRSFPVIFVLMWEELLISMCFLLLLLCDLGALFLMFLLRFWHWERISIMLFDVWSSTMLLLIFRMDPLLMRYFFCAARLYLARWGLFLTMLFSLSDFNKWCLLMISLLCI